MRFAKPSAPAREGIQSLLMNEDVSGFFGYDVDDDHHDGDNQALDNVDSNHKEDISARENHPPQPSPSCPETSLQSTATTAAQAQDNEAEPPRKRTKPETARRMRLSLRPAKPLGRQKALFLFPDKISSNLINHVYNSLSCFFS